MHQHEAEAVERSTAVITRQAIDLKFGEAELPCIVLIAGEPSGVQTDDVDGERQVCVERSAIAEPPVRTLLRSQDLAAEIAADPRPERTAPFRDCLAPTGLGAVRHRK